MNKGISVVLGLAFSSTAMAAAMVPGSSDGAATQQSVQQSVGPQSAAATQSALTQGDLTQQAVQQSVGAQTAAATQPELNKGDLTQKAAQQSLQPSLQKSQKKSMGAHTGSTQNLTRAMSSKSPKAGKTDQPKKKTAFNPDQDQLLPNPQSPTTQLDKAAEDTKLLNLGAKFDWDQVYQQRMLSYHSRGPSKGVIGLLDSSALLRMGSWVNAYTSLTYSESPNAHTPHRFRPGLDQAYLAVGNFHKTPWHGSVGYLYFPFGVYVPFSFTSNVNQGLETTHMKGFTMGYQGEHLYTSAYMFNRSGNVNGESRTYKPQLKNWGTEVGLVMHTKDNNLGSNMNLGYLNNFNQTDTMSGKNPVGINREGGLALHMQLYFHQVGWTFDYTMVTGRYNKNAFSYNNGGALPRAMTNQIYYHFHTFGLPSTIAGSFQTSHQALALADPKWQTTAFYAIDFNKHVSLETQYAFWGDYGRNQTSAIQTQEGPSGSVGTGRRNYMVGARLSFAIGSENPDYPNV